ncbi:disintegrin and metalloproteinase domain-containing protein 10-like isoform X2 [Ruditapes philippinarum]|uniref:disintegrin and metalloproteinase domain-containing protein 10-like isoform X2 n=1 Tax=Ruditapes philippinarum TaxID=129788 RepID=UPI00295BD01C|nr:disintegrin and metalloproteinase domain-containing protein 10-like isoform X2 [Ruditapes philippinarum]
MRQLKVALILLLFEITLGTNFVTGKEELLDKRLLYYEPLHYDIDDLHLLHTKSGKSGGLIRIKLNAFKRSFSLELRRSVQSTSNIILHHKKNTTTPDLSFVYTGKDTDYPESEAKIAVINGTLQGKLIHPRETIYHIAPSSWLFKQPTPFHTVIYSEKDYVWNHTFHSDTVRHAGSKAQLKNKKPLGRRKRDLLPPSNGQDHHVCTVKLTTDTTVWRYFMNLNKNEDKSHYDILFMLENHVSEANKVFRNTEFTLNKGQDTEERLKGIQFEIRKIKIMTDMDCEDNNTSVLCRDDLKGQVLLNKFADEEEEESLSDYDYYYNHDLHDADYQGDAEYKVYEYPTTESKYCLSFLITARVLYINESPLLGLAFHASKDKDGGICSNQNNGFITLFQETTQALPAMVTQLVFTHEVAHAFGALHDSMQECADFNLEEEPADGFYLMHNVAQRGDKPNHHKLSPCSLKYISKALSMDKSTTCFTGSELPYCGNGIVDDGEECDCGNDCYTGKDDCCHPHNATEGLRCMLKAAAQCSPSQGPCCDSSTCQFINKSENFVCQNSKPCVDELYCHGELYGSKCPAPLEHQQREDGFICSRNGRVCDAGSCNASICKLIHWRECLISNDNENLTVKQKEELCYIGCRRRRSDECISSHDIGKVKQHPVFLTLLSNISNGSTMLPIQLPTGTPCNKETGYCDVHKRCQVAGPDTPLPRMKHCHPGTKCEGNIVSILRHYWWAILLAGVVCIYLFCKLFKGFSVHTKSSNRQKECQRNPRKEAQRLEDQDVEYTKKRLLSTVKTVRAFLKQTYTRPYNGNSELQSVREELEALNNNP